MVSDELNIPVWAQTHDFAPVVAVGTLKVAKSNFSKGYSHFVP